MESGTAQSHKMRLHSIQFRAGDAGQKQRCGAEKGIYIMMCNNNNNLWIILILIVLFGCGGCGFGFGCGNNCGCNNGCNNDCGCGC